ncbi:hypothetical protein [Elizabethkingia sp. JS20170427COW]|uniref:hypothetical protein n=1 Tax=Elizabethkingia sp. JS20170427COW TaxID=2583851 RepID=UPI00111024BB|nr:hypothetical protein [Elizabethkingia sp. JS20170427COW]QCX53043.1 hypothetical protein FGE20_04505 [Elizabethkingia sp. JS20170427COW]
MKKLLTTLLFGIFCLTFAQVGWKKTETSPQNNWTFGGGFGLNFGSYNGFGISVAPRIGYKITPNFELGASGGYMYQSNDYYTNNMLHVGPFMNVYLGRSFYLSANFQEYFMRYQHKHTSTKYNHEESALYLGGGYMQRIGNSAYLQIGLSYNVLYQEDKSYFASGLVPGFGVVIGL